MRTGVVFAEARVGDRVGGRQLLGRHVVIGHHHHEAQLPGPFHGLHIADAAVHGQQDARPFFGGEAFDFRDVEAVAFFPPVREVYRGGHVMEAERLQDERGTGDAVHVVVAPDEHVAAFADALFQRVDRFLHTGPAVRGREVAQPRREERIHLSGSFQPALPEQVGYDLRDTQLVRPSGGAGTLIGLVAEFPYFHGDTSVLDVELGGGGRNFLQKVSPSPSKPPPSSSKTFDWWGGCASGVEESKKFKGWIPVGPFPHMKTGWRGEGVGCWEGEGSPL